MTQLVKNVRDKHLVTFDKGSFDNWCVYLTRAGQRRYAPTDTEYFTALKSIGAKYGHAKVYNDFLSFYNLTNTTINTAVLDLITTISYDYETYAEEMDIWFTVIYAGMIAEENKTKAILKKRIKRLGMHQVLLNNIDPQVAANYSKGRKWQELDKIMLEKGF